MDGENEGKKGRSEEGEKMRKLPLPSPSLWISLFLPLYLALLSSSRANSILFQSHSERSENASSYYITYAVHQSDRVWITLSMTPKSWHHQTLGLHGIAVTTSGSLGWGSLTASLTEWSFSPCSPAPSKHDLRLRSLPAKHEKAASFPFCHDSPLYMFLVVFWVLSPQHYTSGFYLNPKNYTHHMYPVFYMHLYYTIAVLMHYCGIDDNMQSIISPYLWSSWTPFAGWFWHPAGARPPLTSSTAESLVLLTADPPWVSSTLANPPNSQCPSLSTPVFLTVGLWRRKSRSNPWWDVRYSSVNEDPALITMLRQCWPMVFEYC